MTIIQHHRPALWEGACPDCSADYHDNTDDRLTTAFMYGPGGTIDWNLQALYTEMHEEHG